MKSNSGSPRESMNQTTQIAPSTLGPVLLLGAAGLVGSAIGAELVRQGAVVRAVLRPGSRPDLLPFEPTEVVFADLTCASDLMAAVADASHVLHFGAATVPATSSIDPKTEFDVTLPSLNKLLRSLVEVSPDARLVFPSSGGTVYGDRSTPAVEDSALLPSSGYALGKCMSEELIAFYSRTRGLRADVVRITNVYGSPRPRTTRQGLIDTFLDDAANGRVSQVWGNVSASRDYIFIDDLVIAILRLLSIGLPSRLHTFNIGSSTSSTILDVLNAIRDATSGVHSYVVATDGFPGINDSRVDSSRFRAATGWEATTDLHIGVQKTWQRKLEWLEQI